MNVRYVMQQKINQQHQKLQQVPNDLTLGHFIFR